MDNSKIQALLSTWESASQPTDKNRALRLLATARSEARTAFAKSRGWRVSNKPFTANQLRLGSWERSKKQAEWYGFPLTEHPAWFICADGKPVAVVVQIYNGIQSLKTVASEHGLKPLVFSWYRPGSTTAVLLTRKAVQ